MGFFEVLGLILIVLKLCGVITWSWFWVTLPLWGDLALSLIFFTVVYLIFNKN